MSIGGIVDTLLKNRLSHFVSSNLENISNFSGAMANLDGAAVSNLVSRVSNSETVAGIVNLLNTNSSAAQDFIAELTRGGKLARFITGMSVSSAGALLGANAASIAASFQIAGSVALTVFSIEVVAVLLLLYGLSIAFPELANIIVSRFKEEIEVLSRIFSGNLFEQ
jgi:hypothetical protein